MDADRWTLSVDRVPPGRPTAGRPGYNPLGPDRRASGAAGDARGRNVVSKGKGHGQETADLLKDAANPIIRPQPGTWKHDRCTSVTVAFKEGRCFFYHDGGMGFWCNGVTGFNWIGLLTCEELRFDGKTVEPFVVNPVLSHGRFCDFDRLGMISPRVHLIDGRFYLYYCGVSYEPFDEEDGYYYMLYGGCNRTWDYPSAIGLARSKDLRRWERHPANPLIQRGEPGAWDDGAMWITEFIKHRGRYYAWFEGRSAGRDRHEEYSPGATKQIGMMTSAGPLW